MPRKKQLTQERLMEVLNYNPGTGQFVWLIDNFDNVKVGKSGFLGVTIKKYLPKPFVAQISGGPGKKTHLGCFKTAEEAHAAYLHEAKKISIKGKVAGSLHNSNGRWRVKIDYQEYLAHQLAWLYMTGEWAPLDIDHKDTDPLNNRWDNLRLATPSQNGGNKKKQENNSGFKGVHKIEGSKINPFVAWIQVRGKKKYLGCFPTPEKAHSAYVSAAVRGFGEYARGG
jgi:hypothetical protein